MPPPWPLSSKRLSTSDHYLSDSPPYVPGSWNTSSVRHLLVLLSQSLTGLGAFYDPQMATLSSTEKYDLITRNLQEVLGGEPLKKLIEEGKEIKCYWGALISASLFD